VVLNLPTNQSFITLFTMVTIC